MSSTNIYVLQLKSGKYYVGQTNKVAKRFEEHKEGKGSAWTSTYKPVKVLEVHTNASPFDEDKITKQYMAKYGVQNVRGGSYTQMKLTNDQIKTLETEICTATGACFLCGDKGHFANACDQEDEEFELSRDEWSEEEYELSCDEWSDDGSELSYEEDNKKLNIRPLRDIFTSEKSGTCYRCGRQGHYASECYARTSVIPVMSKRGVQCYRCGRQGHYASSCWR